MSCSDFIPDLPVNCNQLPKNEYIFLSVKPYVYEVINGKRKRVSPFVVNEKGFITEIKQRAIVKNYGKQKI